MTNTPHRPIPRFALALAFLLVASLRLSADPILLNPENNTPVNEEYLRSILTGTERFWENGHEVLIAVLKNDPKAEQALNRFSGMTASKFKNHWQRIAFSGRGKMPKQFSDIEDLVEFVKRNPGAIAIVSDAKELRGVNVADL
ncbi:hypothetical protein [Pelagicoccus mobilis]|uniref:PBP domain-containing protein n=1 Tax=Pelagicoccus mobilis TaxID=415221 RepID=A0A934RXC9_9BACT|nr:hypothetical protein [Pelagicoccus mobilis]MBK1875619.1 hypothetical protein [Pelagicoccus mobilis]